MLPCETQNCAYRRPIVGDRHSSCVRIFNIEEVKPIVLKITELPVHVMQWFHFPYNYDPVWGPNECNGFAEVEDPKLVRTFSPEDELRVLLGKRMF